MSDSGLKKMNAWLAAKPYWEQYLWSLHLTNSTVEDDEITVCYQLLLEDSGVSEASLHREKPLEFNIPHAEDSDSSTEQFFIEKIDSFKNVNALDESCEITFGKEITVIYGDNGSGKSGIGRLLSNACFSRYPRQLLPNAKSDEDTSEPASAAFHISGQSSIHYTYGDDIEVLKRFSVFDHECAVIHLNQENAIELVPAQVSAFDKVHKSITAIESKLNEDRALKKIDHPTENLFESSSRVASFLNLIDHETTDEEIEEHLTFSADHEVLFQSKKKELEEEQKRDNTKLKNTLSNEIQHLESFLLTIANCTSRLSSEKADRINKAIDTVKEKRENAAQLSIQNFNSPDFQAVGSHEWKSMIEAAHILYNKEQSLQTENDIKKCLLCRQELGQQEHNLFSEYWKFLTSNAESELATAQQKLQLEISDLINLDCPNFSESELSSMILKEELPKEFKKIKTGISEYKKQVRTWLESVSNEMHVEYIDIPIPIEPVTNLIADKGAKISNLSDPTQKITSLKQEITELGHRRQASRLISNVKKYVSYLKWSHQIGSINFASIKRDLTTNKTDIVNELVIKDYVSLFNEEAKKLNCDFDLIIDSRGRDAMTLKELKLNFAQTVNPSEILSEGEQTVSALADFLTENRLNPDNCGIIFDDPTSSLDHERKHKIAERLVEEAKHRQVIIFTHDIGFLIELESFAEQMEVESETSSIRRIGDKVGIIKPELPWIALKVKGKVGDLRQRLQRMEKLENSDPDKYRDDVKTWYGLLRESWERAVEERLFNGVVQRFQKGVQTQRLKKVTITDAFKKTVETNMSKTSKWLHDLAVGTNPSVPKISELKDDLQALDEFIKDCSAD